MKSFLCPRDRASKGAALMIVLAFVVLLTGLSLAYFSSTGSDRQLAQSSFNDTDADLLARSALDIVIGDLKQEIVTGSTVSYDINGNNPIYSPTPAANMLPRRSGNPSGSPDPIPNLVRRSVRSDPIVAPGIASRASAVNSTTDVSQNGRSISTSRWNKHYLIPKSNTLTDDSAPIPSFTPPDWVLVTRNGPAVESSIGSGSSALNNPAASNTNYVIGRYAYTIYDEGGLIDVNVKGYPSPNPSPATYVKDIGRKGRGVFADLSQLNNMSTTGINNVLGWRNYASAQPSGNLTSNLTFNATSAANFVNYALQNSNGFLATSGQTWTGRTDQAFVTRQELINFRAATTGGIFSANVLQYLGTFSRELNRPSWKPSTSTAINPDLSAVRVGTAFTRADGTQAVVGEPLFKTRFALTRINELTNTSNPNIQRDLGLQWDPANNRWNYVGGSGGTVQSTIKTLSQVALENPGREPNFFEILKAVILNGSLGLGSGPANTFVSSEAKYYSAAGGLSADYQIMQIGANIIDAWDNDNTPTFINFANNELAGIENLPYLSKVMLMFIISNHGHGDTFNSWLVPSLWNPHQNASAATGEVRFALTSGTIKSAISNPFPTFFYPPSPVTGTTTDPWIQLRANAFGVPSPPIPSPNTGYNETGKSGGTNISLVEGTSYDGLYFGEIADAFGGGNDWKKVDEVGPIFQTDGSGNLPSFQLQVLVNGSWKPYQQWKAAAQSLAPTVYCWGIHPASHWKQRTFQDPEFVSLDPRTVRFGVWSNDANDTGNDYDYENGAQDTMDENGVMELVTGPTSAATLKPQPLTSFPSSSGTNYYLYSSNATTNEKYADLDGVTRRGDWTTNAAGIANTKTIMYALPIPAPTPNNSQDRPQILSNPPFQSVAELGQVFRDQPWKTLSFSTAASGDAGLLDAFTLQDVPMIAGRTSLNTRQTPALTATLSQAIENLKAGAIVGKTASTSPIIAPADVTTIVNRLSALTAANPMINKGELVTRLMEDATLSANLWNASATNPYNKEARETVIRAFSDASQTRTWNLMIDVIAQSGHYPPNASTLAGFVVEGEKRYWLHIAIDRFTGQIVDQQLEAVYE
jgi:hypothetical protein